MATFSRLKGPIPMVDIEGLTMVDGECGDGLEADSSVPMGCSRDWSMLW